MFLITSSIIHNLSPRLSGLIPFSILCLIESHLKLAEPDNGDYFKIHNVYLKRKYVNKLKPAFELNQFTEDIIDTVRQSILILDIQLRVIKANRVFYNFFKLTPDNTIGEIFYDLADKQWNIPKLKELLETILPEKKTFDDYEVEHVFSITGKRTMLFNARLIERAEGEEKLILLAIEDITQFRRIEEEARVSEEKFRLIFDHVADGISIYRENPNQLKRKLIDCNKQYANMSGRSRDELLKQGTTSEFQTNLEDKTKEQQLNSPEGEPYCGVFSWDRIDGKENIIEYVAMPVTWRGKSYSIGIDRDITERKQNESALKTSEERFRTVAGNLFDVVYEWDIKQKLDWYGDIDSIMGYPPGGYPRTIDGWTLTIHPEDQVNVLEALENHLKNKIPYNVDYRTKRFDGKWRWWSARGTALRNDDGEPYKMIGSITDITERKLSLDALHTSEAKFRSYVNDSPQGIFVVNAKGRYIDANNAALNQIGCSKEYLLQKTITDILPKEELEKGLNHFNRLVKEGKATSELGLLKTNGEKIYVILDTVKISNDHFLGFSTDITERKQAAEALSNERSLLRTIIDLIPDAIYAVDIEGRKILANAKEIELSGKNSEDEIIGKTDFDLYPMSEAQRYYEEDQIIIQSGKPALDMEDTLISKDGQIHWLLGSKVPLRDVHGHITGIVGVNHDITERKRVEESLNASHQLIEGIINTIPIRVFWKDENLVYLGCNNLFAHDAGFTNPKEIIGKDDFQMSWHNQAELYREADFNVMSGGCSKLHIEEPQTTPDGTIITLLTSKIPLLNAKQEIIGVLGVYIDISERKNAEEELRKSNEQLIKLNAEKDKFFSIIAHDLKSPFSGIMNLTELMADNTENFSHAEFIENSKLLNENARNLYKLLENLLEWAQIQKGIIEFTPTDFDLSELVSRSIDTISQQAKQKQIKIINEIQNSQNVYAYEKMIDTILRNLLSNAVKFTRTGGKVMIKSKRFNNGTVQVSVEDNGVGIPEEAVKKLFRIEEKVSSKGTDGELSTGLGLLLCKEFIEMHDGKIWAESEEEKGSTFFFTFREKNLYEAE